MTSLRGQAAPGHVVMWICAGVIALTGLLLLAMEGSFTWLVGWSLAVALFQAFVGVILWSRGRRRP